MRRRPTNASRLLVLAAVAPQQQRWLLTTRGSCSAPSSMVGVGGQTGPLHATRISLARLSVVRPDIASEWIVERNEDMDVMKVECSWEYLAWWKCDVCGHSWKATVVDRAVAEHGCPSCATPSSVAADSAEAASTGGGPTSAVAASGASGESSSSPLSITHPEAASRWHPTRNGTLTPHLVHANSGAQVWWTSEDADNADPFQRSVAYFVRDSRDPRRQAKDAEEVEASLLSSMSSALDAPQFSPMPSTYVWGRDEQMAVVSHLLAASKKRPQNESPGKPLPIAASHSQQGETFGNQPMRSVDETLREKALSFYVHHTVKGKTRIEAPFSTHSAQSMRDALGPIPSSVLHDDQELWKSYFTLSTEESAFSWKRRLGSSNEPSKDMPQAVVATVSDADKQAAAVAAPPPSTTSVDKRPDAPTTIASTPVRDYPRKPRLFETPVPADLDGEIAAPRILTRHAGRTRGGAGVSHGRQRDPDGGIESFGKFDEGLLDEREAMLQYDTTPGADVIADALGDDAPSSALQQQYSRDGGSARGQQYPKRSNFKPRRAFSLELPKEASTTPDGGNGGSSPLGASIQAIPNAPRVVARPRRASTSKDE